MSEFAARFYDGKTSQPQNVRAQATQDGLHIMAQDGHTLDDWPWASAYVVSKPKAGMKGTLGRIDNDTCRIIVSDEDWRTHIAPYAKTLRAGVPDGTWRFLGIIAAVCLGIIAAGPDILDMASNAVPDAWLQRVGKDTVSFIVADHKYCRGSALAARALDRFVKQADADHAGMKIYVVSNAQVNALTAAGRNLVIFDGLLKTAPGPQALAGVLAHEVGHAHYRHPIRSILRGEGMVFLLSAVFGAGGGTANTAGMLLSLKNSRAFEMQADAYSVKHMTENGYDPNGLVAFLAQMQKKGTAEDVAPEWIMSHPDTAKRIDALKKEIAQQKQPRAYKSPFTQAEWRAIQSYCK